MNSIKKLRESPTFIKFSSYWRICKKLSGLVIAVGGVYTGTVLGMMTLRERLVKVKQYREPTWEGFTEEQKERIIKNRGPIVAAVRAFYENGESAVLNPQLPQLFSDDCILQDPVTRCIGIGEIVRAYRLLPSVFRKIYFTKFEPIHHEKMIQITNYRVSELKDDYNVERHSNLMIYLTQEEGEEKEKAYYIADEWGHVGIVVPETHNKYLWAGSMANLLRRGLTWYQFLRHEKDKSWLNPWWTLDARNAGYRKAGELLTSVLEPAEEETIHDTRKDNEKIFNAGAGDLNNVAK